MALPQPESDFVSGASEERFQAIADASPDAFITIEITGRVRYWNRSAAKMFGYDRRDMIGANVTKLMPARFKSAHRRGMTHFYETGAGKYMGKTLEVTGRRHDGAEFPMELSLSAWHDRDQVLVTGVVRDISDRKEAHREVSYRSELLDSATDSVFVSDRQGQIIFANRAALEARGYQLEELLGTSVFELTTSPFRSRLRTVMRKLFAGDAPIIFESEHHRRDGSVIPIEVHARAVQLEDEVVYTAVVRDISARRRRERFEAALGVINEALAGAFGVSEAMSTVMEAAADALGAAAGCILERTDDHWRSGCLVGMSHLEVEGLSLSPSEIAAIVETAKSGESTLLSAPREATDDLAAEARVWRSLIVVPIVIHDAVRGIACFAGSREASFGPQEQRFADRLSLTLSLAWENEGLHRAQRDIADTLQDVLLVLPEHLPGIRYSGVHRSATEAAKVGGDFYDLMDLGNGRVGVTIGDIVGKGIEAAAMTSLARSIIRAYAYEHDSPAKVMELANMAMMSSAADVLLTAFYGVLSLRDDRFTYCSAGHPPPLIVNSAGRVVRTNTTSPLIGLSTDLQYKDEWSELALGDKLVLYTDGVIESRNGPEFFGDERLGRLVGDVGDRSPEAITTALLEAVGEFSNGRLIDDIALLCLERLSHPSIADGAENV